MTKAEYQKAVKDLDFAKLSKADKKLGELMKNFNDEVNKPNSGDFNQTFNYEGEKVTISEAMDKAFQVIEENMPTVLKAKKDAKPQAEKSESEILKLKIKGFKSALMFAEAKEKKVLEIKIKGFESALKFI